MNKTIREIKEAKKRLEDTISSLLMQFEAENEVQINDLSAYPREIRSGCGETIGHQIGISIIIKI